MQARYLLPVSALLLMTAPLVSAQATTVAQFTQTQPGQEFEAFSNTTTGDLTFSTIDTTAGVPINFSYLVPAVNPQPAFLILSAVTPLTSSTIGTQTAAYNFSNPQDDHLTIKDAQGSTLLSASFTGILYFTGNNFLTPSQTITSASFNTTSLTYGPGVLPPSGSAGDFSIALSSLAPSANSVLAAGAGTFDVTSVPEPASLSALCLALGAVAIRRRRTALRA